MSIDHCDGSAARARRPNTRTSSRALGAAASVIAPLAARIEAERRLPGRGGEGARRRARLQARGVPRAFRRLRGRRRDVDRRRRSDRARRRLGRMVRDDRRDVGLDERLRRRRHGARDLRARRRDRRGRDGADGACGDRRPADGYPGSPDAGRLPADASTPAGGWAARSSSGRAEGRERGAPGDALLDLPRRSDAGRRHLARERPPRNREPRRRGQRRARAAGALVLALRAPARR